MTYLLDTNVCIALINGTPGSVRARFESALRSHDHICISSIVMFELWYGVAKSSRPEKNKQRLSSFLAAPLEIVGFDEEDAAEAGKQRAALESIGRPIGAYDVLIGSQAVRRGWTVATANVEEFARIKELRWEDWGKFLMSRKHSKCAP